METIGQIFCTSPHQLYHHHHHHHHHQQQQPVIAGENSFIYQFQEIPEENWYRERYGEEEEEEEEEEESSSMDDFLERLLKEVDAKGHGMMKKLISKVENNVPFEEEFRDTWHHLTGKRASRMLEKIARNVGRERGGEFVRGERGIDMEGELKNERFKMKTVNTTGSGVVKEEEERH